jgi:hypothetical protein
MTCKERLKKLIAACDKELSTDPASKNQWRESEWGVFMDESESWENIRKAVLEAEK